MNNLRKKGVINSATMAPQQVVILNVLSLKKLKKNLTLNQEDIKEIARTFVLSFQADYTTVLKKAPVSEKRLINNPLTGCDWGSASVYTLRYTMLKYLCAVVVTAVACVHFWGFHRSVTSHITARGRDAASLSDRGVLRNNGKTKMFLCFVDATFHLRGGTFHFIFWKHNQNGFIFVLFSRPCRTAVYLSLICWSGLKTNTQ